MLTRRTLLAAGALAAAARYLVTEADLIAFTDSTTMGLGLLYSGLSLGPGDEVLTTEHDFYSTHELAAALKDGRAGLPNVRLHTPRSESPSSGIVCCEVDGLSAPDAVDRLWQANVQASATPYSPSYLRFGPSILNNESDVDKAPAAVRALT